MDELDDTIFLQDEESFASSVYYDEEVISDDLEDDHELSNDFDPQPDDEVEVTDEESNFPKIKLTDSSYISLFGAPCLFLANGSKEALLALKDRMSYLRRVSSAKKKDSKETQKSRPRTLAVGTSYPLKQSAEVFTFVSPHMIYDSLEKVDIEKGNDSKNCWSSDVFLIMNRILHSNVCPPYWSLETSFLTDPLNLALSYTYTPMVVYDLSDFRLEGYRVTRMHQVTHRILVVGMSHPTNMNGAVTVWNLKNLNHAEHFYKFGHQVTCVKLSERSPNLMAVGLSDGEVIVADISSKTLKIMYQVPDLGPLLVSDIQWWAVGDDGVEDLVFAMGNFVYRVTRPLATGEVKILMQSTYLTHSELGLRKTNACSLTVGPSVRGLFCPAAQKGYYLLGDAEGSLRLCNFHSSNEYFDIILAHTGVINFIKVSPYDQKLFLTCGSDGKARIWYLHIHEPLLTLDSALLCSDLRDVTWSPVHATIIAGITPDHICIWDLHRKLHEPVSVSSLMKSPTCIEFAKDGKTMIVGSIGGAQIVGFNEMPFPETYKSASVIRAIIWWLKYDQKFELLSEFKAKVSKNKKKKLNFV